jgi:hypothetical protein
MFLLKIEGTVSNVSVKFPRMRVLYSVPKMILGDVRVQTGAEDRTCPLIYALAIPRKDRSIQFKMNSVENEIQSR